MSIGNIDNLNVLSFVEPNTYFHIILKVPIASTPANLQYFRGIAHVNGYFE